MNSKKFFEPMSQNQKNIILHGLKLNNVSEKDFLNAFFIKKLNEINKAGFLNIIKNFDELMEVIKNPED